MYSAYLAAHSQEAEQTVANPSSRPRSICTWYTPAFMDGFIEQHTWQYSGCSMLTSI